MPIFTDTPVRQSFLDEYEAPLSSVLGARASQAFEQGLTYIQRSGDLVKAQEGAPIFPFAIPGRYEPDSPLVPATDARQRVKDEGLEIDVPDDGIRERALGILMDTKREERRRQDIISRGPGGFVAGALGIGASFAGAAADPLNIATAFVPVIGEARYAALLARAGGVAGRAATRFGVGAAEGAAGATLLEPFVYSAARHLQADYDITDSLANIAFGTVLGGGLHVGVGAASDALSRGLDWRTAKANPAEPLPRAIEAMDYQSRAAVMRTALAQALDGREIDVAPLLPNASSLVQQNAAPTSPAGVDNLSTRSDAAAADNLAIADRAADNFATAPEPAQATVYMAPADIGRVNRRAGETQLLQRQDGTFVERWQNRRGQWSERPATVSAAPFEGGRPVRLEPVKTTDNLSTVSDVSRQVGDSAFRIVPTRGAKAMRPDPRQTLQTPSRLADPEAVRAADETLKATANTRAPYDRDVMDVETGLDEVMTSVQDLATALDIPDLPARDLAPFDAMIETARELGRAVIAAANCQLRRG